MRRLIWHTQSQLNLEPYIKSALVIGLGRDFNKSHHNYIQRAFRQQIFKAETTQSMSRVARCIDNGPMEGFWGVMKREMYYTKKY